MVTSDYSLCARFKTDIVDFNYMSYLDTSIQQNNFRHISYLVDFFCRDGKLSMHPKDRDSGKRDFGIHKTPK